jgi:hypothetical protein
VQSPDTGAVLATIELVASEQRALLPWLLDILSNSPVRYAILNLQTDWQTGDIAGLAEVAKKAAHDLDRLERYRSHWGHPSRVVGEPHLAALFSFSRQRYERAQGITRLRRLEVIGRRLERLYGQQRQRQKLEAFLRKPVGPVDPDWLRDFLRRPSQGG